MSEGKLPWGAVRLRPLRDADAETIATLANDKRIWNNVRDYFPYPYRLQDAREFIVDTAGNPESPTRGILYNDRLAGVISITLLQDVYRHSGEIGYWVGVPYWGKGVGTEAVRLMTDYGINTLKLNRLQAGVFAYNIPSMKVLEKCGYRKEGIMRDAVLKNHRYWDEHRYAYLRK